jgi:hypothetical protein
MSDEQQQTHEYVVIQATDVEVFNTKKEAEAHAKIMRDARENAVGYQPYEMYFFIVKNKKQGNLPYGDGVITELSQ